MYSYRLNHFVCSIYCIKIYLIDQHNLSQYLWIPLFRGFSMELNSKLHVGNLAAHNFLFFLLFFLEYT